MYCSYLNNKTLHGPEVSYITRLRTNRRVEIGRSEISSDELYSFQERS